MKNHPICFSMRKILWTGVRGGTAALEEAKREDKPIFLSIGYSTCHWCHVMAHESFEAEEVAAVLNRAFIPIKVDREERPDVDAVYMAACIAMNGSGGWPLTVLLTPDQKPFWAGTYLPKPQLLSLLEQADKPEPLNLCGSPSIHSHKIEIYKRIKICTGLHYAYLLKY